MREQKRLALYIFLYFLGVMILTCSGHIGGDALFNYYTVESLIFDGDLDLANLRGEFHVPEMQEAHQRVLESIHINLDPVRGTYYSKYGIIVVLLELPFYLLGLGLSKILPFAHNDYLTIISVSLVNCFVMAALCVYFWFFVRELGGSRNNRLLLTHILAVGTYCWVYAVKSGFTDLPMVLFLFAAFYHAHRFRKTMQVTHSWLVFTYMGAAVLTKFYCLPAAGCIGLYMIFPVLTQTGKRQHLARIILPLLVTGFIGGAIFLGLNYIRFGHFLSTGYSQEWAVVGWDFNVLNIVARFIGLTISSGKGLLFYAPVLVLVFWAFPEFHKRYRWECLTMAGIIVMFVTLSLTSSYWVGDYAWGSRYMLPILPFLLLMLTVLETSWSHGKWRRVLSTLLSVGFVFQLPAVLVNFAQYIRFTEQYSIHYQRYFYPEYSPIFAGFAQLYSAMHRTWTGQSIALPILYSKAAGPEFLVTANHSGAAYRYGSFAGFDQWDLLWVHAWNFSSNPVWGYLVTGMIAVLVAALCVLFVKIRHTDAAAA